MTGNVLTQVGVLPRKSARTAVPNSTLEASDLRASTRYVQEASRITRNFPKRCLRTRPVPRCGSRYIPIAAPAGREVE
jgi:hypothetical protein